MITCDFAYNSPGSLQEAVEQLNQEDRNLLPLAGGTDLLLNIKKGNLCPDGLVDIKRLAELKNIREESGLIRIGAAVSFAKILESTVVKNYANALIQAVKTIGSPQIRSTATPGGNIVNASPAADSVPPLLVLNAKVKLQDFDGSREMPLEEFLCGMNRTRKKPSEIMTEIYFEKPEGVYATSFSKLGRRKALNIARLSTAVFLKRDSNFSTIREAKISLGAVSENPFRVLEAEEYLIGKEPKKEVLEQTIKIISNVTAEALGSRKSAPFKRESVKGVAWQALFHAVNWVS